MAAATAAARSQRREGREEEAEKARAVWAGGTRKNAREARASILQWLREGDETNDHTAHAAFISRAIVRAACHAHPPPCLSLLCHGPTRYTFASDGLIPLVCVGFFKSVTACGVVWLWLHRYRAVQQKNCCPCATALSTRAIGAAVAVRLASLRTQRGGRERYQRCSGGNGDKHETGSCSMRALQRKKKE
jgi:hypothetical protein